MNLTNPGSIAAALLLSLLAGCGSRPESADESHAATPAADFERGPHRGRLLSDGDFAVELQVFEDGVPPEFHVHLFRDGKPLPPQSAEVSVKLKRLDGEENQFAFTPDGDFLKGDGVVVEPHSFKVEVVASESGKEHRWAFDSFEGRTTIAAATAEAAGIRTEVAGAAVLSDTLLLSGRLAANQERVRSVTARFPGPVRAVDRSVGDVVRSGERLALVESNESLQNYAVTAPISGVIVERNVNPGENAGAAALFVIADHSTLWAELPLFSRDLDRIRAGQRVTLRSPEGDREAQGKVLRVVTGDASRRDLPGTQIVRVELANADRRWSPGMFVDAAVEVGKYPVELAVKRSALQGFRDFTVVFALVGETWEVRMLELGRQDETWVEVTGGLKPGTRYASDNSYLIKADIEKSGASHDH